MTPFTTLASVAIPIVRDNIDTDTIIPSREMRSSGRTGLADGLFAPWRYSDVETRTPDSGFPLNDERAQGASIILGGANFGCGSSREHAVWALAEYGIRCIIAESFAPIFYANCIRNAVLPLTLPRDIIDAAGWEKLTVDLHEMQVCTLAGAHAFTIDDEARTMLLHGLDPIDLTLQQSSQITDWLATDKAARPWVYLEKRP